MRCLLLAVLLLSGCGLAATHEARSPSGVLIGGNVVDLVDCAGMPDKTQQTESDQMAMQWSVSSNTPAFQATLALVGSIQIGDAGSCKMVATVLRDGTVADVAFPGATASLTGGPYASCEQIVGECLLHPDSTGLPKGYDAIAMFLPGSAKK